MSTLSRTILRPGFGSNLLPVGILAIIAMMVLPLPVSLLDAFFVGNILLSLLLLLVALHTYKPLDFSSFPSLLLITTVLRLALNVASTRAVLTNGHTGTDAAGHVIEAFGAFVIAGNFAVGIVVFVILVIINLVVITKGSGRVSEVSARFTLDAMPGKQMAIDADLNSGNLTPDEARSRRKEVAEEADFYGAMDGASKFVKGDAIAGILILLANILGGIVIGMAQYGLSLGTAAQTYVLLSIGDGLVAQIPSLLLSIATAIIVTRVSSNHDFASHIGTQIGISQAWIPAAILMAILGFIPGMPNIPFLLAAVVAGGIAWLTKTDQAEGGNDAFARKQGKAAELPASRAHAGPEEPDSGVITPNDVTDYAPITIHIGYGLIPLIDEANGGALVSRITGVRRDVSRSMGFVVPAVRIRDDLQLPSNNYRIRIGQAIVAEDTVYPDRKLAIPGDRSTQKLRGISVKDPSFGMNAVWISPHQRAEAEADDQVVVDPDSVVATHLSQMLYKHAGQLLMPDDVQGLLDTLEHHQPTLVQSVVPKLVPLHVLTSVMRNLLRERIPVADLPRILDGLADLSGRNLETVDLAEVLRPTLASQLLQQLVPLKEALPLITLSPQLEELLARSRANDSGLIVDQSLAAQILNSVNDATEQSAANGRNAVVVVSAALRRAFADFLRSHGADVVVLAVTELPENRNIEIVATIEGTPQPQRVKAPEQGDEQ